LHGLEDNTKGFKFLFQLSDILLARLEAIYHFVECHGALQGKADESHDTRRNRERIGHIYQANPRFEEYCVKYNGKGFILDQAVESPCRK
jgi:hypothetical protein